jgi:ribosomal protein S18 acetylase RimI-like enzyme
MLISPDGRVVSAHYLPPSAPASPTASDIATAKAGLQAQLGEYARDDGALLAAAIEKIQQGNAAISTDALARAAILQQEQYDASHHRPQNPSVDPLKQAESEVGLSHQFDQRTLDAAVKSLSDGPLATTAPAARSSAGPAVSLADARSAIQAGLDSGLSWQEAVNAARVQFGGLTQNETALDEAALTVDGDQLATGADARHGDVLNDAAYQLATLRVFGDESNRAALAALEVTLTPSPTLSAEAKRANATWLSLQQDIAAHRDPSRIATDSQAYHMALSAELDDAGNKPAAGTTSTSSATSWADDPSQIDRRWLAERAVMDANTAAGMHGPNTADLSTALRASEILDAMEAAPAGVGAGSGAAANLKAAQVLTQRLAGVSPRNDLYRQVMSDPRTAVLENAAFGDITGVQGTDARATLNAQGAALSGYRNTVIFPALLHDTLASPTTQHALPAVGTPDNLNDIATLLDSLAQASPELAQALFAQMQGKIEALIGKGPEVIAQVAPASPLPSGDAYYAPLARIIDDAGGPKSTATQPVVDALRKQLQHQQAQIDEGGTEALDSAFEPLASLHAPQYQHSTAVYQTLIDEAPTSELSKTLEKYTGLKPQSESAATPVSPADASALAQAETALEGQLGSGPVNADTLQAALAAAMADKGDDGKLVNANIGGTTWAQAAIVAQLQADGRANAGSNAPAQPGDVIERVSRELSGDQLFDADTLDAATRALEGGTLVDGTVPLKLQQLPSASGGSAADYMGALIGEGTTMPEAIALTRAWLGGRSGSEPALVQAALEVRAEQPDIMQQYYDDSSKDPIKLAAQQLKEMNKTLGASAPHSTNGLDPTLIDQVVNGTSAMPGMAQNIKPDLTALNDANGKPGLIGQAQSAYDAWQRAQAKADANPNDSNTQSAARTALTQYHAALSAALNAAAGRKPGDDASWQADDSNIDTLWKARIQFQKIALAPQRQAAQDAPDDSAQSQALDAALQQWQTGFDALRIIVRAQASQQQASAQAGGDAGAGSLAAAKSLAQLDGLAPDDPLYRQVMGDGFVASVRSSALASMTSAAQPFMPCASGDGAAALKARFHAEATRLQQYQSTPIYAQLMDDVASDPATQHLFSAIQDEVQWRKNDSQKLATLADVLEGSGSTDLSARFVHQMFGAGGAKPGFSPDQLVAWTRHSNDVTQIARIYQAAGAAQNQDMTDLRHALETMVTSGDPKFGGASGSSGLNKRTVTGESSTRVSGEDLRFGDLKKHYVQMQLAQDMLDDDSKDALGKEIARETGFRDQGKPAPGISASAPGEAALTDDAEYAPGAGVAVSTGGNLVGLQLPDGMQTFSSDAALLNASGSAYGLTVAHTPTTLAQERALSDGTFALYDPNQTVFDAGGRKTTLGQVFASLKRGSGAEMASALTPVTMGSLSGQWWNTRTPGKDQQGTSFTLLEGISAGGGLIDVGPADSTARHGYANWQSHTGFAKGFMTVQPHWVVNAQGEDLTDSAYFTSYEPDMSWWERWGSVAQIAGTVAAGILTLAAPEAAPLWLALAADGADAYLATTAAIGSIGALKRLSNAQGADDWVNWLNLAANLSGAAASGFGALSRTAAIGDSLGARAGAYADVTGMTSAADPAIATAGATRMTTAFPATMRAWQDVAPVRLLGRAAIVANGASMGQQTEALVQAELEGKPISAQDWLGLASSTALSLVGAGIGRARGDNAEADPGLPARPSANTLPRRLLPANLGPVKLLPPDMAADICRLDAQAFGEHQSVSIEEVALISKHGFFVGIRNEEGELVAYASVIDRPCSYHGIAYVEQLKPQQWYLEAIAASPFARGAGHGKQVLGSVMQMAKRNEVIEVRASLRPENHSSMHRFVNNHGFEIVGYHEHYFPEIDGDRLIARRDLTKTTRYEIDEATMAMADLGERLNDKAVHTIGIPIGDEPDVLTRQLLREALAEGFVGVAFLRRPPDTGASILALVHPQRIDGG